MTQNIKFILIAVGIILLFIIIKNMFGNGSANKSKLQEVITNEAFLVDVRTPDEFASGSVKGAVNIPLDKISFNLSKFKNKKNIVVFCRSGNRSGQAKQILEKSGIQHVTNGGTWQQVSRIIQENIEK